MQRDFTFIDDIVEGVFRCCFKKPQLSDKDIREKNFSAPHQIFNIGNSNPQKLMDYINCIEKAIGIEAKKEFLPMQNGDVISKNITMHKTKKT